MALYDALMLCGSLLSGFAFFWVLIVKIWNAQLPPGPFPLPLVGNLFSLRRPAYENFAKLSRKYGPVLFVKLGKLQIVVVNDAATAKEVLHAHDVDFADRPKTKSFELFSFGFKDLAFASRDGAAALRRVSSIHLFTGARLKSFTLSRETEIRSVVKSTLRLMESGSVDVGAMAGEYISSITCMMLFGHKLENARKVVEAVLEMAANGTELNVGLMFPVIDFLDLHGNYKAVTKFVSCLESLLADLIAQRRTKPDKGDDFLSVLLSMGTLDDTTIMGLMTDMIGGGVETSLNTIEWAMAEMLCKPSIMEQAQAEMDKVVGRSRLVQEADLNDLPFIQAIFKETLRLHPPLPLSLPHYNEVPSTISGYKIPAKCHVLVNIWGIGRDPNRWAEPAAFMPERFLGPSKDVSLTSQNLELLPFSAGRRICIGYSLALKSIPLAIANFVHAFHWKPAGNICLEDRHGTINLKAANAIRASACPRLDQVAYL